MSRCGKKSIKILSIALLATLPITVLAEETKEQHFARMSAIQAELAALKSLLGSNTESGQQFNALQTELNQISASLGGDLPCATGPSPSGTSTLRVPAPAPVGCVPTTTNFATAVPVGIPTGPAVVSSTINVSGADTYLWDVDVRTFITHTFNADLDITIQSPAGTVVTLTTDNGGGNDDIFNGTVWDDSANPGGQVPYTTNNGLVTDHVYSNLTLASPLVPEEALAAFVGEDPNGTWTITISDDLSGDGGSLNSWDLNLTTFPTPVITMPVQGFTDNTAIPIPTGPGVTTSTIAVSGVSLPICKLDLVTDLAHTFPGDLDITLTSPNGTIVTLTTDNGAGNDNIFAGTVWDDFANPAGQVPYTTNDGLTTDHAYVNLTTATPLVAEESLGAFLGELANGDWVLTISDDTGGDGGSLNSWSINFTPCTCAQADLSVTLGDSPDPVTAGTNLTYTVTATNNGPSDADNVSIDLPLPMGTSFVSANAGAGGVCNAASPVTCSWAGATANGASRVATIVAAVNAGQTAALNATATTTSDTTDTSPGNNTAAASTNVAVASDLAITKVAAGVPVPLDLGSAFSYNLGVSNSGPSNATGVVVSDSLPATLNYVSNTCGATFVAPTLTWNIGALNSGGNQNCTVNVTVADFGTITNTANVSSASADPNNANNSATSMMAGVAFPADLAIGLSADIMGDLPVGSSFIYTVTTVNNGPGDANGLQFTMNLSNKLEFDASTCGAVPSGNTLTWMEPTLANGAALVCEITVTAFLPGDIQSSVSVATASDDPVTSDNTALLGITTIALPVPALAQFGLYLLILLSLGLGLVAMRRQGRTARVQR